MKKIRLFKYHFCNNSPYNDADYDSFFLTPFSDWQEVDDETFKLLTSYAGRAILDKKNIFLIVEDVTSPKTIDDYVSDIKQFLIDEKNREEERKNKEKERARKAKATSEARKIAKAKKLLESQGLKVSE